MIHSYRIRAGIAGRSLHRDDRGFGPAQAATELPHSGCVRHNGNCLLQHVRHDEGSWLQDWLDAVDNPSVGLTARRQANVRGLAAYPVPRDESDYERARALVIDLWRCVCAEPYATYKPLFYNGLYVRAS